MTVIIGGTYHSQHIGAQIVYITFYFKKSCNCTPSTTITTFSPIYNKFLLAELLFTQKTTNTFVFFFVKKKIAYSTENIIF